MRASCGVGTRLDPKVISACCHCNNSDNNDNVNNRRRAILMVFYSLLVPPYKFKSGVAMWRLLVRHVAADSDFILFIPFFVWLRKRGKEGKWFFSTFSAQIVPCLPHTRWKSAEQMTATSLFLCPVLLIFEVGITVILWWQRISRRGDFRRSAREQHGWNKKPFVTF